jgi:hypothetical protein
VNLLCQLVHETLSPADNVGRVPVHDASINGLSPK